MTTAKDEASKTVTTATQKKRVRSPYLFPAYDFTLARQVAERIEMDGAGSLSEETLAIALKLSAKSSGFQLKTLTARQFGLVTKQAETLSTTPVAKAIFKPTGEDERRKALAQSFLAIPLFREVASRFKGQPLPQGQAFRNILEREFGIDSKRVSDAERVLMDSARETGVLVTSGTNTYLSTEKAGTEITVKEPLPAETPQNKLPPSDKQEPLPSSAPSVRGISHIIAEEDLKALDKEHFKKFWEAYGEIVWLRARKGQTMDSDEKTK